MGTVSVIYTCPAGPIRVVGARFSRTLTLVVRGRLCDETEGRVVGGAAYTSV